MKISKNFNSEEFDSKDIKGTGMMMNIEFIALLQKAREIQPVFPFVINSGFRTTA